MDLEFRCFADPKPKLPGERIVVARGVPWQLSAVRYAFRSVAEEGGDSSTRVRWHDAADFQADDDLLLFHVPAGVANGLTRGERYRVAVAESASKPILRGEILWELQPLPWNAGVMDMDAEVAPGPPNEPSAAEERGVPPPGAVFRRGMLGGALLLLLVLGIWLAFPDPDSAVPQEPNSEGNWTNHPPVAATISITAVEGEVLVVDTREHTRDPDGDIPRLLELEPAQYGVVERIDSYAFRYRAPPQRREADVFLYRVVDESSATGEGWVFVTVGSRSRGPARAQPTSFGRSASISGRPSEANSFSTESVDGIPSKAGQSPIKETAGTSGDLKGVVARVSDKGAAATEEDPVDTPAEAVAEPMQIAAVARQSEPIPDSWAKSERAGSSSEVTVAESKALRAQIADALDAEDMQRVRSLCGEAMGTNASLAKFCGIVFDPNKRIFESHPDATFALACYDQAARLGDAEAGTLAAAVRSLVVPGP